MPWHPWYQTFFQAPSPMPRQVLLWRPLPPKKKQQTSFTGQPLPCVKRLPRSRPWKKNAWIPAEQEVMPLDHLTYPPQQPLLWQDAESPLPSTATGVSQASAAVPTFSKPLGFLFAPKFHGAMRHAAAARKEVGIRSIFNMLGPLTNPAAAKCQLLGVFDPKLTEMFAQTLKLLGTHRALVVHGHDGMDEITVCAPTRVSELANGMIRSYDLDPLEFFDSYADPSELKGGDAKINAAITTAILKGEKGARRNIVLINSAAALMASDAVEDLAKGNQDGTNFN
eukprot:TRINITY_DN48899_c0_g1_i2.p1 TRINITY_DN48899_c0_g1~~TRINITY_DN48899_c0_g1_i2.p1  ORF type:complete len:282 (-),score=26.18 TRINITY_DN48899_c0_g1_i2:385-1230(-)